MRSGTRNLIPSIRGWVLSGLLVAGSPAAAIVIDNGLAPPNPANVYTGGEFDVQVRDGGCANEPAPCPNPGPPTTVEVQGDVFELYVYDSSTAIVTSGFIDVAISTNTSLLQLDGGDIWQVQAVDHSSILLTGTEVYGFFGIVMRESSTLTMTGGFTERLLLEHSSSAHISGGDVGGMDTLAVVDNATALITGGFVGGDHAPIYAESGGVITWAGGNVVSGLMASSDGVIRVVGTGFAVDGVPVGYGALGSQYGQLTGTLAGGNAIDIGFAQEGGTIVLIPEPATALLVAGGLAILASGRRRQRAR